MILPPLQLSGELPGLRSDHSNRARCRALRVVAQLGTRACNADGHDDLVWNAPFTISPVTVIFDDDNLTLRVQYDWSDAIVVPISWSPESLHVSQTAATSSHHEAHGGFCVNVTWMPQSRAHAEPYQATLPCCCASIWFFSGSDKWWFLQRVSFAAEVCRETIRAKELQRKAFPVLHGSLEDNPELSVERLGSHLFTACGSLSMPATSSDGGTPSPVLEELPSDSDVEETHPSGTEGLGEDGESGIASCDLLLDADNVPDSERRGEVNASPRVDPLWRSTSLPPTATTTTTSSSPKGHPPRMADLNSRAATVDGADAQTLLGGQRWATGFREPQTTAEPPFLSSFHAPPISRVAVPHAAFSPSLRFQGDHSWPNSDGAFLSLRRSMNTRRTSQSNNPPPVEDRSDALLLPLVQLIRRRACRREPTVTCRWCTKDGVDLAHERTCTLREVVCDACGETFEASVIHAHKQQRHSRRTRSSRSTTVAIAKAEALLELLGSGRDSSLLRDPMVPSKRCERARPPMSTSAVGGTTATQSKSLTMATEAAHDSVAGTVPIRSDAVQDVASEVMVEPIDTVDVERLDSSSTSSATSEGLQGAAATTTANKSHAGSLAPYQGRADDSRGGTEASDTIPRGPQIPVHSESKGQSNRMISSLARAPKSRPLVSPPNTGEVRVQERPPSQRLSPQRSSGALQPLLRDKRPSQDTDELLRRLHSSGIVLHRPSRGADVHPRPTTAPPARHPSTGRASLRGAQRESSGHSWPATTDDFDVLLTQQMGGLRRSQSRYSSDAGARSDEVVCRHCGRRGGHGGQECPERRLRCKRCGGFTLYSEKERHRERCPAALRRRHSVDDRRRRTER